MADVGHLFGGDLQISATGDLLAVDSVLESTQRILRRLSTNPNDYIWNPAYGSGLPQKIGSTLNQPELTALIKSQMALEQSVMQNPAPAVTIQPISNGFSVAIQYTEQDTLAPATLSFEVTQ